VLHLRAEHVVDKLERGDLAALVGVHGIEDAVQSLVMAIRHPDRARRARVGGGAEGRAPL